MICKLEGQDTNESLPNILSSQFLEDPKALLRNVPLDLALTALPHPPGAFESHSWECQVSQHRHLYMRHHDYESASYRNLNL